MERRTIKTCHGLQEVVLLDGALVSPDESLLAVLIARVKRQEKEMQFEMDQVAWEIVSQWLTGAGAALTEK